MITIKYVTTLPLGLNIEEVLQANLELGEQLRILREYANNVHTCDIIKDYDPISNQYLTIYCWANQEAIDEFYSWANTNVGNYNSIVLEITDLVESVGGKILRTVTIDEENYNVF
jgi:beta-mannanase